MKVLLILPAGENVRVTRERPRVPKRAMLRFSVLPLTTVAALTPPENEVRIVDENVEPLDFDVECDVVGAGKRLSIPDGRRHHEVCRTEGS